MIQFICLGKRSQKWDMNIVKSRFGWLQFGYKKRAYAPFVINGLCNLSR